MLRVLAGELGQQVRDDLARSPTIGTSTLLFLPISAGSMSAWTIVAFGAKRRQQAGDPVVEAGAEGHHEVGLLQRRDGGDGAVHAGHAQVLRVGVGQRATRHERGDDGGAGRVGQARAAGRTRGRG